MAFTFLSFNMPSSATTIEIRQGDSWESGEPILGNDIKFLPRITGREVSLLLWTDRKEAQIAQKVQL